MSSTSTKVGLDDFLVASGADGLRQVIAAAEAPPPLSIIRCNASELDSVQTMETYLSTFQVDGVSSLRFWGGSWHRWVAGAYREQLNDEVRADLVNHLGEVASNVRMSITGNHYEVLKAKAILPVSIQPPAWIGERPPVAWDPRDILVCRNGMVHLPSLVAGQTDFQRPLSPKLFVTSALNYDFSLRVPPPENWLDFLHRLWSSDVASIETLQEIFGYLLTADTSQQKIFLLVGPPRSGKGTLARVLQRMIGVENVAGPTLSSLATNFGLWPLLGKSVAIVSDARLGNRIDSTIVVERLLASSGEDLLTVDRKNLPPVNGKLSARFLILTNELPRVDDASGALAGRMVILRLTESWLGREDPQLTERLSAELPGILLWAIAGWARLRARGHFVSPASGADLQEQLREFASPVAAFVRAACDVGVDFEIPKEELYRAYQNWCCSRGGRPKNDAEFGRQLNAAVPSLGDRQRGSGRQRRRVYTGIRLAPDA